MKWRRVATGFIEVIKEGQSHIVLFKRSDRVNSYAGCWASISGSIELINNPSSVGAISDPYDYKVGDYYVESPIECAFREVEEETQFKVGKQLKFIRSGRPQYLPLSNEKGFIVYPFLFRLAVDNCSKDISSQLYELGFKIDWEHETFKVFDTENFLRKTVSDNTTPTLYETVPNLRDTLHRMYFVSGPEKQLLLDIDNDIINNFTDGASTIALKTINIMIKALDVFSSEEVLDYFKIMNRSVNEETLKTLFLISKFRDIVWILNQCRTEMPMIGNVAVQSFSEMINDFGMDEKSISDQLSKQTFETMLKEMKESLNSFHTKLENNTQILSNKLKEYLESNYLKNNTHQKISILTHSWSSAVVKSLKDLILTFNEKYQSKSLAIYVTESQPEKEGYKTAQVLKDFITKNHTNATVQVCTEASVGFLCRSGKIDLMCVGTDSIHTSSNNITISNKTGTSILYCVSRFYNIPFVVLSESMKISHDGTNADANSTIDNSLLLKQHLFEHFTLVNDTKQTIVFLEIDHANSLSEIQTNLEMQRLNIFGSTV